MEAKVLGDVIDAQDHTWTLLNSLPYKLQCFAFSLAMLEALFFQSCQWNILISLEFCPSGW
jgi:hypothetical protein